jgi:hypothetical protein
MQKALKFNNLSAFSFGEFSSNTLKYQRKRDKTETKLKITFSGNGKSRKIGKNTSMSLIIQSITLLAQLHD